MKSNEEQLIWNGVPVLTTRMLAERLGVQEKNIQENFQNNKEWYNKEDFFFIKGSDLKILKNELHRFNRGSYQIEKRAKHAYLWRESGAHNQAKSSNTDQAWEAFLYLKNNYYLQKAALKAIKEAIGYSDSPLFQHTKREIQVYNSKEANKRNYQEGGIAKTKEYNFKSCKLHSGKSTTEIKALGLKRGLNKSVCKSAKAVLRIMDPAIAASMSVTDDLYKMGAPLEEIAPLSVAAQPLLAKMHEYGLLIQKSA